MKKLQAISHFAKKWERTHLKILSSYLRPFNYKCAWNLLPFGNETGNYTPSSKTSCPFWKVGPDAAYHIFLHARRPKHNRKKNTIHAEKLLKINLKNNKVENLCELMFNYDLHPNKEKLLTSLNTVTKHQIWKTRLRCVIDNHAFSLNKLSIDVNKAFNFRLTAIRRNHPNIVDNMK